VDFERLIEFVRRRRNPLLALGLFGSSGFLLQTYVGVLSPFLVAFVLAYVLTPVVRSMRRVGPRKRKPSQLFCVLTLFIALFGGMVVFGIPLLVNLTGGLVRIASGLERADLQQEASVIVQRYEKVLLDLPLPEEAQKRVKEFFSNPKEISRVLVAAFQKGRSLLSTVLRGGAKFLATFFSAGFQLMLVPILLFYFLLEYEEIYPSFLRFVPVPYRSWMERFLGKVDLSLGGFVRGQLLIAFLFGTTMTVGLWFIGIRFAVVLGPLSGIANMVPYLGVVVGLVPAFFLALWQGGLSMQSVWLCGAILALFVVLQLLDGYVFQPRILGPSVELHPLWIMLALALGEHVMGLAGMMLAVPVAAILRVLVEETYPLLYDLEIDSPEVAENDSREDADE
jgi:predicted PurR-regulated permease PerM